MSLYLDINVIYSLTFADAHSERADVWVRRQVLPAIVVDWRNSNFTRLSVACRAAVRSVRAPLPSDWPTSSALSRPRLEVSRPPSAGALAVELARDAALKLSAADALPLASAADAGCLLVTFDQRLADAARARG